jgi:hypothetical protein
MKKHLILLLLIPSLTWGEANLDDLGGLVLECKNTSNLEINEIRFFGYSFETEIIEKKYLVDGFAWNDGEKFKFRKGYHHIYFSDRLTEPLDGFEVAYYTTLDEVYILSYHYKKDDILEDWSKIDRDTLKEYSTNGYSRILDNYQCKVFKGTKLELFDSWHKKIEKKIKKQKKKNKI